MFMGPFLQPPILVHEPTLGILLKKKIGKVMEVDVDDTDWSEYLRVLVKIHLSTPLARGRAMKYKENKLWIPMKYEKLLRSVSSME